MYIEQSAEHRALKNISLSALPVYYTNNRNARMVANQLKEWFPDKFVPAVKSYTKGKNWNFIIAIKIYFING